MALLTRYINTGSNSGGDGTTNNTTGSTRAYVSLSAAEAAEQTDLVTDGDSIEFLCSGSAADTTACTFAGWTTGASNTITVRPHADDVNATGIYDTDLYRITTSGSYSNDIYDDGIGNIHIQGIQVAPTGSSTVAIKMWGSATGETSVIGCILKGSGAAEQVGINFGAWGADFDIANNVTFDFASHGMWQQIYMGAGEIIVYNNTVDSCGSGLVLSSGLGTTSRIYNNLLTNNTTDYTSPSTPTSTDNNVTSDATGPDTGHTSKTITYTDAANDDYSTSDADVVDLGTDLSADSYYAVTVDIIGVSRSSTPTIGAFEYATSGTQTLSPTAIVSAEAFGVSTISTGAVTVSPSSIASAESFGAATITIGAVTLSPSSIPSLEAFGSPTLSTGIVQLQPSAIPSAEAFGAAVVTVGAAIISPGGIVSAEGFGVAVITGGAAPVILDGLTQDLTFDLTLALTRDITGA